MRKAHLLTALPLAALLTGAASPAAFAQDTGAAAPKESQYPDRLDGAFSAGGDLAEDNAPRGGPVPV